MTQPQDNERKDDALKMAMLFHDTYERLAPSFNYKTRIDTCIFNPESPNGKLMIAVCAEIISADAKKANPLAFIIEDKNGVKIVRLAEHVDPHRLIAVKCTPLCAGATPAQTIEPPDDAEIDRIHQTASKKSYEKFDAGASIKEWRRAFVRAILEYRGKEAE